MEQEDRLKIYQAFADLGRKWSPIMDAKAAFLSALNVALLNLIWGAVKLGEATAISFWLGLVASCLSALSLFIALQVVLPRVTLSHIFGRPLKYKNGHKALSFFGFIAANYPIEEHDKYIEHMNAMEEPDFVREAMEQHYTISHVVQRKSDGVALGGWVWFSSLLVTILAIALKG